MQLTKLRSSSQDHNLREVDNNKQKAQCQRTADNSRLFSRVPLVSVVIPAYNAEAFLLRTLGSIVKQTYRNLEILVIDDGSSDRTPIIVNEFVQTDNRIRLIQKKNAGVAAARNLGIQSALGEFIAPIDADDLWHANALEKMLACFLMSDSQLGVVYAWSVDIDKNDQSTGSFHASLIQGKIYKTLICHNFLGNASATLIRKSCLEHIGGYDTRLKEQNAQGCEDWDLYLRLAELYTFDVVPEFLIGYRKARIGMSSDLVKMACSQQLMLQSIQHKHPEIPYFLFRLSRSSFYLYLAHESESYGNFRGTLSWLWQGVKIDPITPLGRLGLYKLLLKSLARLAVEFFPFSVKDTRLKCITLEPKHSPSSYANYIPKALTKLQVNSPKVMFKVALGKVLHMLLLTV